MHYPAPVSKAIFVLALCFLAACDSGSDLVKIAGVYVRFHVRDARTLAPVAGVTIRSGSSWSQVTDANGNAVYGGNDDGDLYFTIEEPDYVDVRKLVFVDFDSTAYDTISLVKPADHIVASYKFSNNFLDSSGKGHNGTPQGCAFADDRFGRPSSALELNGTTDFVSVANAADLNFGGTTDFTLCAWINTSEPQDPTANPYLIDKSTTVVNFFTGFTLGYHQGSYLRAKAGTTFGEMSLLDIDRGADGKWHLITCAFYRSGKILLYYDGEPIRSSDDQYHILEGNISTTVPLLLGGSGTQATGFKGKLDDIRIYDLALDEKFVKKLYHENGW